MQKIFHSGEHLYFLPIGGTAMAGLAGLLHEQGHRVEGVDTALYPPMSTLLEDLGIPVRVGWDPDRIPPADRVIIGNALPRSHPEVQRVLADRRPYLSQAEAVSHYLLSEGRDSLVVAGTHGKTTTTSMAAWIFERLGTDPTTLVGGLLKWSRRSFRLGRGPWMIIEGDEYNTAFFDRGPKFIHYRPRIFLLGPVEFDHADLYHDLDAVLTAFRAGTAQVPFHGTVVVNADWPNTLACVGHPSGAVFTVGSAAGCDLRIGETVPGEPGRTPLEYQSQTAELRLDMPGRHNVENAAMATAGAIAAGLDFRRAVEALAEFPGVARRLDIVGEASGVTVVDDFAHHPTALKVTVAAARARWPGRRLVVAYEPRSMTAARKEFEDGVVDALGGADLALMAAPHYAGRLEPDRRFDRSAVARSLRARGVRLIEPGDADDPVECLTREVRRGDVVIGCSSGSFDGFHRRLLERLKEDEG